MRLHVLFFAILATSCAHAVVVSSGEDGPLGVSALRDPSSPNHAAFDSVVTIGNAVVTDLKTAGHTHGFFVQDLVSTSWAGVYVFVGTGDVNVAIGDVVTITGTYRLYAGLEEVDVSAGSVTTTGSTSRPDPIDTTLADITDGAPHQLEYQSMLLRVHDVSVVSGSIQQDSFTVRDGEQTSLLVTSYVMSDTGPMPFDTSDGATFQSIVGHGYAHDGASLAPGSPSDLAN